VAPDISTVEFVPESLRDGGELMEVTRRNVTESVAITIAGTSTSVVQSAINDLEELFSQAEHHQRRGLGDKVWVEYRPGASGDVYRSELLFGKFEPSRATATPSHWADAAVQGLLVLRRRFFWEGPETELSLSNGGGSGTGGRTVYNHDDAGTGHDNYVAISGGAVAGVIPTPAEIQIKNTLNSGTRSYRFWIGLNAFSVPGTLAQIYEGEDADYAVGGSDQADANSSGGYYKQITWSGDTEQRLICWAITAAQCNAARGNFFRILARFATSIPSGVKLTPKIMWPSGSYTTVVAEGQEVALGTGRLQDLGAIQLPPWLVGETDLNPIDLCLYGRKTGGGSLDVDYLQITPLDGYRRLVPRGSGLAYNARVVDDGIEDSLWSDGWTGGGKTGHYIGYGSPIHLWPGRAQRLYFLASNSSGGCDIARTHEIRVYYRPRRLTV
jgi:hypothetical protein